MPKYDIHSWSTGGRGPSWVRDSNGILQGVDGSTCLSNLVLRLLLTTKGSCPTARGEGTSLSRLAGATLDLGQVQAMVMSALQEVSTYVRRMQLRNPVPAEETLVRLAPQKVLRSADSTLTVRILIYNAANTTSTLDVTL